MRVNSHGYTNGNGRSEVFASVFPFHPRHALHLDVRQDGGFAGRGAIPVIRVLVPSLAGASVVHHPVPAGPGSLWGFGHSHRLGASGLPEGLFLLVGWFWGVEGEGVLEVLEELGLHSRLV